jgi:hypothetical protein
MAQQNFDSRLRQKSSSSVHIPPVKSRTLLLLEVLLGEFAFPGVVTMIPGAYAFRAYIGCVQIMQGGTSAPLPLVTETLALIVTCLLMVAAIAIGIAAPLIPIEISPGFCGTSTHTWSDSCA